MPSKKPAKKAAKKGEPVKALSTRKLMKFIKQTKTEMEEELKGEGKKKPRTGKQIGDEINKLRKSDIADPINHKKPSKKISDEDDFDEPQEATEDQLATITREARKAVALQKQINDLEAATSTLNEELAEVIRKTLPSLLDSAGLVNFELDDGSVIEIKEVVSGTLPSEKERPEDRKAAMDWLLENGGSGIIKTSYNTEFGVGQEKLAKMFEALITRAKFIAKKSTGVHPQTLCAFVREKLESGEEVPVEKLGVYAGRHAKIKLSADAAAKAELERVKPKVRRV